MSKKEKSLKINASFGDTIKKLSNSDMAKFKIGDIVNHKIGSVRMIVVGTHDISVKDDLSKMDTGYSCKYYSQSRGEFITQEFFSFELESSD